MFRELREEVGLAPEDVGVAGVTREWIRYRLPKKYVRKQGPRCIGQKQRWFLLTLQAARAKLCFDSIIRFVQILDVLHEVGDTTSLGSEPTQL